MLISLASVTEGSGDRVAQSWSYPLLMQYWRELDLPLYTCWKVGKLALMTLPDSIAWESWP